MIQRRSNKPRTIQEVIGKRNQNRMCPYSMQLTVTGINMPGALEDFDKTTPSVQKQTTKTTEAITNERVDDEVPTSPATQPSSSLPDAPQPDFGALFSEGWDGATAEFENVMKSMLGDDTELLAQFSELSKATAAAATSEGKVICKQIFKP